MSTHMLIMAALALAISALTYAGGNAWPWISIYWLTVFVYWLRQRLRARWTK